MKKPMLDQIVEAVLYEGYILYPYRASAKKNRQRFTFGRVYPRAYAIAQDGAEPFVIQTECLLRSKADEPAVEVEVRFLHPMKRSVHSICPTAWELPPDEVLSKLKPVPELWVDGKLFQTWTEAVERHVKPDPIRLRAVSPDGPREVNLPFCFSESRSVEPLRNKRRRIPGVVIRQQEGLEGVLRISAEPAGAELYKVTVRIFNHTPVSQAELEDSEAVMMRTFASTHTILRVQGGEFVSLTDPPSDCRDWADKCKNFGTWPVLVGDETKGERDTLLSSPIILSDYPKIAPESQGNLFDGTEIDEMLTLRILTMTDEELHEMRHLDEHSRRVLERTEAMRPEQLMKMHGVMREESSFDEQIFGSSRRLEDVAVGGARLRPGDRVRIRPKARADVMDLALNGKTAVIEAVEQDAEGGIHLALVLPDDPGKDLGLQRQTGHRFFYRLDEIEPLGEGS